MKKLMLLLAVFSGVLWGSSGIFVRTLDAYGFDNCTMISVRLMIAVVILFIGIFIFDKSMLRIKPKDIWIFLVCGVLGMVGLNLCYVESVTRLTLSLAAVLLSLLPVFVMLLAAVILKESITKRKVGCTALAVLGCILVSGALELDKGIMLSMIGVIAGVAAAFFYALYSVFSKVAMKQNYNVFTITFYSMLTGVIVLLPFTDWAVIGSFEAASPVKSTLFMLLNALCTSVLPYVLYTVSLRYVDTGRVSILASGGEPSAALVFGVLFFDEIPTVLSFCGLIVTIIAIWLLCRSEKKIEADIETVENDSES